jgi:hypothetical protein
VIPACCLRIFIIIKPSSGAIATMRGNSSPARWERRKMDLQLCRQYRPTSFFFTPTSHGIHFVEADCVSWVQLLLLHSFSSNLSHTSSQRGSFSKVLPKGDPDNTECHSMILNRKFGNPSHQCSNIGSRATIPQEAYSPEMPLKFGG